MGYTPGPWKAERDECHFGSLSTVVGGDETVKWHDRRLIIQVGGSAPLEEQEATTVLISAAPELLESLKAVERWYPRGWSLEFDVAMTTARAAIAKAEGRP